MLRYETKLRFYGHPDYGLGEVPYLRIARTCPTGKVGILDQTSYHVGVRCQGCRSYPAGPSLDQGTMQAGYMSSVPAPINRVCGVVHIGRIISPCSCSAWGSTGFADSPLRPLRALSPNNVGRTSTSHHAVNIYKV